MYKNKVWKLEAIKEIVVKRYSLIRQAAEIYFDNSKSVFFSVFSKQCLKNFILNFKGIKEKRKDLNITIVTSPLEYFLEKKYCSEWVKSNISNYEYLMQINKYSGRSFNDINQYPIFPWIISNYENPKFELQDEKNYRDLKLTILGITPNKRLEADKQLSKTLSSKDPCQSNILYSQGSNVLDYLFRLEPYGSIILKRENNKQIRRLHSVKEIWQNVLFDKNDNKELIPEYYYLFELFKHSKKCQSHDAINNPEINTMYPLEPPVWAEDHHHFVKLNSLALESKFASNNLCFWIDMIFGFKQQDQRSYNLFKSLCDENHISKNWENLDMTELEDIHTNGAIPIPLFMDAHPGKSMDKLKYTLFNPENKDVRYSLTIVQELHSQAIKYIKATDYRVFVVLAKQKLIRSQEFYLNSPGDNTFIFEKKLLQLPPYKNCDGYSMDTKRTFAILQKGKYLLSCWHYDYTCKITTIATGDNYMDLCFHLVQYI